MAYARDGNRPRPVSLAALIRSSTRAWARVVAPHADRVDTDGRAHPDPDRHRQPSGESDNGPGVVGVCAQVGGEGDGEGEQPQPGGQLPTAQALRLWPPCPGSDSMHQDESYLCECI
jgi:hypothetical protein